LDCHLSKIL